MGNCSTCVKKQTPSKPRYHIGHIGHYLCFVATVYHQDLIVDAQDYHLGAVFWLCYLDSYMIGRAGSTLPLGCYGITSTLQPIVKIPVRVHPTSSIQIAVCRIAMIPT